MFSTDEDTGRISPPQKRARTLDIADVACLVTTRQRAAFPSPEKPSGSSVFGLSSDIAAPLSTTTVEETQDEFSQELIEEDTVIQSSLPQYLSHVYGGGRHSDPGAANTNCCSVSTASCSSKLSPPAIVESQGFTVTEISDQPKTSVTNNESDTPCAAKPESSSNTQSSPLLFDSPTSLPISSPTHARPNISTAADRQQSPVSHPQTVAAKPCTHSTTKSEMEENVANSGDSVKKRSSRKRKFSAGTKAEKLNYTCPPLCVNLAECAAMKPESLVHLFALVLQVNSVMEVACKKGPLAGSTVPVASLLLADPTRSCLKLLLWREAASWVERISAGDIIFLKCVFPRNNGECTPALRLKRWQGETVAHTIMYSRVLNLHQPKKSLPQKFVKMVPAGSLESLVEWGKSRHGYLFRDTHPLPSSQRPVHFRSSDQLGVESVVHFRAKLTSVISERESLPFSLSFQVFLFSDRPGKDIFLYLLSSSRQGGGWYRELRSGLGEVWELHYLSVSLEGTQGSFSLQVTSRSTLRKLPSDSNDAKAIMKVFPSSSRNSSVSLVDSISTLLECKSSGIKKCRAKATQFNFQLSGGEVLCLGQLAELSGPELVSRLLGAVYVGCQACTKPLRIDENCIYCPCEDCKKKSPGGTFTSSYCYRPLVVRLTDRSGALDVIASQVAVSKLLGGVEAAELFKINLAQNEWKREAVKDAVGRLLNSGQNDCWILNTVFVVDEFSFVESLTVSLVDWTASDFH